MKQYTRDQIIDLHYNKRGEPEKRELIDYLLKLWDIFDNKEVHLKADLIRLLDRYSDSVIDGPFILLMTMRNRRDMRDEITRMEHKDEYKQLKSFLNHLVNQQKNIHTPDESIRALLSHKNYAKKKNHIIMFEIERVRRIRAKATPTNQNLSLCISILRTLEPSEEFDDYGGIYVPSEAVQGLIELQKALTYGRTFNFNQILESSQQSRKLIDAVSNPSFNKIRNIMVWWTHIIDARTFSKCYMEKEALSSHKFANEIKENGNGIDKNKKEYLKSITPDEKLQLGVVVNDDGFSGLFERLFQSHSAEQTDYLHAYHVLLSGYIYRKETNVKKPFKSDGFMNCLPKDVKEMVKTKKWSTKVLKRECNQLLTRGIIGDYHKDFKPQPLFFDHNTIREKDVLSKRMLKNSVVTKILAQAAHERQNSLVILQLSLILIDLLIKNKWLSEVIHQRLSSRPKNTSRKVKINSQSIEKDYKSDLLQAMDLTKLCIDKLDSILKRLELENHNPLLDWVEYCKKSFPVLHQDSEKNLIPFIDYCKLVICFDNQNRVKETHEIKLQYEKGGVYEKISLHTKFTDSEDSNNDLSLYETSPGELKFTADGGYYS
tara:strand:+ start:1570 stop:3375 length:1806 start_codon:yes stop_codon:yes gene_type:complete